MAGRTHSVTFRKRAGQVTDASRPRQTPADEEQVGAELLNTLSKREREILVSFYLLDRSPEEICGQMGLTETQFRLLKSRAKARFGQLAERGLSLTRTPGVSGSTPVRKTKNTKPLANRFLPIAAHAVAVFGDELKAARWFATPLPLLNNRSPEEVFDDKDGPEIVERILTRIEHNIPS